MQDRASPPAPTASADSAVAVPTVLEAVIRALATALATGGAQPTQPGKPADGKPLLDLEETAELLGVSRMTVARMADEGRLLIRGHPPGAGAKDPPDPTGIRGPDDRRCLRGRAS